MKIVPNTSNYRLNDSPKLQTRLTSKKFAALKIRTLVYWLLITIYIGLLAGTFDLSRIWDSVSLGEFGIIAYWNLLAVIPIAFLLVSNKKYRKHANKVNTNVFLWSMSLLFFYMILSTFWSTVIYMDSSFSLSLIVQLGYLIIIMLTTHLVLNRFPDMRYRIVGWLFTTALIYAVAGILSYDGTERMAAFAGGPNVFVRIIAVGFLSGFYFWLQGKGVKFLFALPLFLGAAFASGSRGGILALIIASFYFLIVVLWKSNTSKRLIIITSIVYLLVALLIIFSSNLDVSESVYQRFIIQTFQEGYLSTRDQLFDIAWELFLQHPIFGAGLGEFKLFAPFDHLTYPHNFILHIASEGGTIGLVFIILIFIAILRSAIRFFRRISLVGHLMLALCIFYFIASLFSGNLYDNRFMWFFILMFFADVNEASLGQSLRRQHFATSSVKFQK